MKAFISPEVLKTKTKVGYIDHPYVTVAVDELKKLSLKEAYEKFIDALYNDGKAVVFNDKAIVLHKKTAYVGKLETGNPPVVLYNSWKRIVNLKHEFKQFIGIELK